MQFQSLSSWIDSQALFELSQNSTVYHRSMKKMEVGEVIKPKTTKTGEHWLKSKPFERALEFEREKSWPDRPSRLNCVYSSPTPRSRFVDKGYLYVVKLQGRFFMTDSTLIDMMDIDYNTNTTNQSMRADWRQFYEDLKDPEFAAQFLSYYDAKRYWDPAQHLLSRSNIENLEILSDSAVVTEVINDDRIRVKDYIEITEPKILVVLTLYIDSKFFENKEKNPAAVDPIMLEFEELFIDPKTVYNRYESGEGNVRISGMLKPGKRFMLASVRTNVGNESDRGSRYSELDFFPFVFGKYLWRGQERKFPQITEIGITGFRMNHFNHSNSTLRDASRYMKRIGSHENLKDI